MAGSNAHRNVSVDITGNSDDLGRAYDDAMRKSQKFHDQEEKNNRDREDGIKSLAFKTGEELGKMGGEFGKLLTRTNGIMALIVAGIVALGPAAQLTAGAITLAFGSALATIGIMAAARSAVVRGEFSAMKDGILDSLQEMAGPIEQTLLGLPQHLRDAFSLFAPELEGSFLKLGPALDAFFERFSLGFAELAPALGPITDGFIALLDAIGLQSPAMFAHFADGLTTLANAASRHADTFAAMLQGVFAFVSTTSDLIGYLADEWSIFMSQIEAGMKYVSNGNWVADLDNSDATWQRITASIDSMRDSINKVAITMDGATVSATALSIELDRLSGAHLNADLAALAYSEALDKATMAAKDGQDGLLLYRHEGQINVKLLLDLAKKSHDYINAKAEEGLTVQQLRGIYEVHRQNLYDAVLGMTKSESKARELTDRYLRIPKSIMTKVDADTIGAQNAVDNFITLNSGRRIPIDVYNRNAQLADGGMVGRDGYASGGPLRGPGGSRTDSIPINASRGEFIMNASATRRYLPALEAMNSGRGGAGVGGMTVIYQINTTVSPTANLAAVGGTIVEAIQSYEQRSGRTWRDN